MPRISTLLGVSCLGTAAALLGGSALLRWQPPLTPESGSASLERIRRWAPDPERRREAALLLHSRYGEDPRLGRQLLRGQGWGPDPLAAVVLKHAALDSEGLGDRSAAQSLWQQLWRRFPGNPASADALYALGRRQPRLRQELHRRFPAHPAALAAALEAGPEPAARLAGSLHLAQWGPRWPGAEPQLRQACGQQPRPTTEQRAQLASGLAELGDGGAAIRCLEGPDPAWGELTDGGRLRLVRTLLKGDGAQRERGIGLLLALVRRNGTNAGDAADAGEMVRLLARQEGAEAQAALAALPSAWRDSAPVAARRVLADPAGQGGLAVLQRWPQDPASWDLQWELARRQLLAGRWQAAQALLEAIPAERLPLPLAVRQQFWRGYSQRQLGERDAAAATWRALRQRQAGGYYDWRAAVQLGQADGRLPAASPGAAGDPASAGQPWDPLGSGDPQLDQLWRLDQRTDAWEHWRERRRGRPPGEAAALLVEGRLRQGVGDDWTGFSQLEQAALELRPDQCSLLGPLKRSLHPPLFLALLRPWAERRQVPVTLLQGIAKQESRFSPTVHSAAGAVGLMQLLPSTASELAGRPVSAGELEQPDLNAQLGSLYVRQLLQQAGGNPLVAVASYNAGAGAAGGWIDGRLRATPELWVEAIPYPETRLYVKKVLGNAWTYANPAPPRC
ncbi:MAG: transglycosylase SLT domain-containing protein [Cyanobium sp.]